MAGSNADRRVTEAFDLSGSRNGSTGGQRKRVEPARALVKDPTLLLLVLDEPLSDLDTTLQRTLRTGIKMLPERLGATTVLATQDQIQATTTADRITCMRDGRIEQIGTTGREVLYVVDSATGTPRALKSDGSDRKPSAPNRRGATGRWAVSTPVPPPAQ
ncbi:MAG: hypothetical protein OXI81_00460 [Paracoccaceae bacterium]|nr:hypothetical protein [Paracoccaceae bacterium]